ncbi:ATP citrate synthase [Candidatus Saccharibacteria bacterium]|jgi:succinyl-CoA synthetase alpha subunit|nr:ATP citrate synthase [Candidatus Saccharibacteria bacterium]
MLNLAKIRSGSRNILVLGNYRPAIQSALDYDYFSGHDTPSIVGIVTAGNKFQKYFWGKKEILIPCFKSTEAAAKHVKASWMFNINSGRRAYFSTQEFFDTFPDASGGHIFAEDVPEEFAIDLYNKYQKSGKTLIGTAGVGMMVPGVFKLGVVGGIDWRQFSEKELHIPGGAAVLSASGGMVNEIITIVARGGHHLSFAICFGGDRFPTTSPRDAFLASEADDQTKFIVYYGELGGHDEYELAELMDNGQITKPVIAYIAGVVGESFDEEIQFGHAKALARLQNETATAKREALAEAGAQVASDMTEFVKLINDMPKEEVEKGAIDTDLLGRKPSLFSSTISSEQEDGYAFVGKTLSDWTSEGDFIKQVVSGLLGRQPKSELTIEFVRTVFQLSIDHGPQVSGALNTIVTARAGKNLVDSLAAGLLTIGPRFGGAVNGAAGEWFKGASEKLDPKDHVEGYAKQRKFILGIGHKKYRIGLPDPRTKAIEEIANKLADHPHLDYARSVEAITTEKKSNLILNIDGYIAALALDILAQEEGYLTEDLQQLIDIDFFNALFVIPRSIGFVSHYLDQKRLDEGLFRLPDDAVSLN